jgi:ABC-type transport system substrate-binding protein
VEAELKLQEYGAYFATTIQGKFEGLAMGPTAPAWEPDFVLSGYIAKAPTNIGHVHDPTLTAMVQAQRRMKDLAARKQLIMDIQRYVAEQQYRVDLISAMVTSSWQPYVKNFAPNQTFDVGGRAAALWLAR